MASWKTRDLRTGLLVWLGLALAVAGAEPSPTPTRVPWTSSRIQDSPDPPAPFRITPAFPKLRFDHPTSLTEIPGQGRLLVTEMGGKIFSFPKEPEMAEPELMVDLTKLLPREFSGQSVSLLHATFHPKFPQHRFLFVCYGSPVGGRHQRVSRFTLTGDSPPRFVSGSEELVIQWPAGGHSGGCLQFGKDGYLYISTGDGSGPNPPDGRTTGQDVSDLLGAILRVDVDQATGSQRYAIPPDNPFVGQAGVRPEIWAYGLRNPWKFGTDTATDALFVADNGWETWETVHRIQRGSNCGWPIMEGRVALRTEVKPGPTPIIPPAKDHPHTEANSVIGGPIYRGSALSGLDGSFIYGDYITGTIWALRVDETDDYHHTTLVDTDLRIVAFAQGRREELYVLDYDFTGQIYQLVPSGLEDNSANFPRRLSETGLFTSLDDMQPSPGVIPYRVQAEQWHDGAHAQRWAAIPGSGQVRLATDSAPLAEYPEGTVFVKHLRLPQDQHGKSTPLETQILHYEQGQWRPYSYLWDDDGRDALLVSAIGADRLLEMSNQDGGLVERTWPVGARTECRLCHNAASGSILGFVANQLVGQVDGNDQPTTLAAMGVLAESPPSATSSPLVNPHDTSQALDDRARSYLHANCSMCHHPGGSAIVSFYLRRDMPLAKLNTNKGTGIGTFGMQHAKIIARGDPYRSILLYRMSKLGYGRMPYIGSRVVDSAGVALIEKWIRSLPSSTTELSALVTKGSPDYHALQVLSPTANTDRRQRDAAIGRLTATTEGTLALIAQLHRGSLDESDHQSAVATGRESSRSDIRGLFEHFVPESERRVTLGPNVEPASILTLRGDVARGKLIFFSDVARCQNCHAPSNPSDSVGPTLAEINKKHATRPELLAQILDPSLKVDDRFATYLVVGGGRVVSGLLVNANDREVTIRTAEKKNIRISRGEIDEMRRAEKSLMPDRLLSDLTAQEAADLLAYIASLRTE